MPVTVQFQGGARPWKLVEAGGKVVGSSTTKKDANIAASIRNRESKGK